MLHGILAGVVVGAGEPCWIEANSFALSWSALWSGCASVISGILCAGAWCAHMTRLDGARGGGGLCQRGTGDERKRRKTNDETVARHLVLLLPVTINLRPGLPVPK